MWFDFAARTEGLDPFGEHRGGDGGFHFCDAVVDGGLEKSERFLRGEGTQFYITSTDYRKKRNKIFFQTSPIGHPLILILGHPLIFGW
jgi:hypothetical protein